MPVPSARAATHSDGAWISLAPSSLQPTCRSRSGPTPAPRHAVPNAARARAPAASTRACTALEWGPASPSEPGSVCCQSAQRASRPPYPGHDAATTRFHTTAVTVIGAPPLFRVAAYLSPHKTPCAHEITHPLIADRGVQRCARLVPSPHGPGAARAHDGGGRQPLYVQRESASSEGTDGGVRATAAVGSAGCRRGRCWPGVLALLQTVVLWLIALIHPERVSRRRPPGEPPRALLRGPRARLGDTPRDACAREGGRRGGGGGGGDAARRDDALARRRAGRAPAARCAPSYLHTLSAIRVPVPRAISGVRDAGETAGRARQR